MFKDFRNKIFVGNCLNLLKQYPDDSIDCLVTSPPYYKKRAYGTNYQIWDEDLKCEHDWEISDKLLNHKLCKKCGAWLGEIGQEIYPEDYIRHLVQIFTEFKRVMKPTGTMWINIGDTYYSSEFVKHSYLKPKDLIGIPWMLSMELQKKGFYLRNDIIWSKPNPMPRSVTDRCTESHEYILFFTKSPTYYFNMDKVRETAITKYYGASKTIGHNKDSKTVNIDKDGNISQKLRESSTATIPNPLGRIKRDVWISNVVSSTRSLCDVKKLGLEFHHAMYSEDLIEPCVKAGCPEGGIVYDPFMGSGTTAIVALKNKCDYTGTELNDDYIKIIEKRIETVDLDKINGNNTLKDLLEI